MQPPKNKSVVATIAAHVERFKATVASSPEHTEFMTSSEILLLTPVRLHAFSLSNYEALVFSDNVSLKRDGRQQIGLSSSSLNFMRSPDGPSESVKKNQLFPVPVLNAGKFVMSTIALNDVLSVDLLSRTTVVVYLNTGFWAPDSGSSTPTSRVNFEVEKRPERPYASFDFTNAPRQGTAQGADNQSSVAEEFYHKINDYLQHFNSRRASTRLDFHPADTMRGLVIPPSLSIPSVIPRAERTAAESRLCENVMGSPSDTAFFRDDV